MVYPTIVVKGKEAAYIFLIQVMCQLSVGTLSSINTDKPPAAPLRSTALLWKYMSILETHFPNLQPNAATQQHNQIA
jgi:hypothetical protein